MNADMDPITIEHNVTPAKLDVLGVDDWPVWKKDVSTFDWQYDDIETCYIVEGVAEVTPEGGDTITLREGDLVIFPRGMKCAWNIISAIEKHYRSG